MMLVKTDREPFLEDELRTDFYSGRHNKLKNVRKMTFKKLKLNLRI